MTGDQLDLSSDTGDQSGTANSGERQPSSRFLGVRFACCAVYARVYVNRDQTAYVGHCPKCSRRVRMQIGADGTDSRFFTAY